MNRNFKNFFLLTILLSNQFLFTADKVPAMVSSQELLAGRFPRFRPQIPDHVPPVRRNIPNDAPNQPKSGLLDEGYQVPVSTDSLDSQQLRNIAYTATKQAEKKSISNIFEQKVIKEAQQQLAKQVGVSLGIEIDPFLTIRNQVEEVSATAAMKAANKKISLGVVDSDVYTTAKSVSDAIASQTYSDIQKIGKQVNKSAQDAAFQVVNSAAISKANSGMVKKAAFEAAKAAAEKAAIEELKRLRQEQRVVFITKTTLQALITAAAIAAVYKATQEEPEETPQN